VLARAVMLSTGVVSCRFNSVKIDTTQKGYKRVNTKVGGLLLDPSIVGITIGESLQCWTNRLSNILGPRWPKSIRVGKIFEGMISGGCSSKTVCSYITR
jgi:hypothetical protein